MTEENELPGMPPPALPRRGSVAWTVREWRRFRQLCRLHDGLTSPAFAAEVLQLSRQRVGQLIDAGRLRTYTVFDRPFIPCDELAEFAKIDRPEGRPVGALQAA
jgi:hypothetical protein